MNKHNKPYLYRPVHLVNYKTGREIVAPSITHFCEEAGLNGNDKYHITPILNGERLHHKGWHVPYHASADLQDINGYIYRMDNLFTFAKKHKISLPKLKELVDGVRDIYRGLFLAGRRPKRIVPQQFNYVLTFEKGHEKIQGMNMAALGRLTGVCGSGFRKLKHGMLAEHKGWELAKVVAKRKAKVLR